MKKKLICAMAVLMAAVTVCRAAAPAMAEGLCMYIETGNQGRLHLRAQPEAGAESLGLYRNGTQVLVEGFANGCWAAVLVNGRRGYMNMDYLAACEAALPARISAAAQSCQYPTVRQQVVGSTPTAMKPMYVSCGSLHLRAYASQSAESLGLFPSGTQVYAADLGNGWSYALVNGLYGCMMTRYLSPVPAVYEYVSPAPTQAARYMPQAASSAFCAGSVVTVRNPNSSFVYLRSSKDSDRRDNILAKVPVGAQAILLEPGEYWSRILCEGIEGVMASRYLR